MGGTVIIAPGFLHRTGLGWFLIPHPPLINMLLRQGLQKIPAIFGLILEHITILTEVGIPQYLRKQATLLL